MPTPKTILIIDDDTTAISGLPNDYGVDDIPVIITNANFTEDGQLDEENGWVGDTMIISPPLVISEEQIDELIGKVRLCLDATAKDVLG